MQSTNLFTIGHSTRSIEQFLDLLAAHGIRHLIDVRTVPGSRRNPQFNRHGLADALAGATIDYRVVFMCAEAVPWRCHRSLIADALIARGFQPMEIVSNLRVRPHVLTAWARVEGTQVTYPAAAEDKTSK